MELLITLALGLFFLAGIIIVKVTSKKELIEEGSIAIACGAIIALCAFDLVPEIIESFPVEDLWRAALFVLFGALLLNALDRFIPEHASHDEDLGGNRIHIGIISTVAITLHNILEGMTVYNIAAASLSSGLSLGLSVGLHNIPMGMLIYATLKHEKKIKKYVFLFVSFISTFIGGCLMMGIRDMLNDLILSCLICITLGMVLFIILFELVPSVFHSKRKDLSVIFIIAGFFIVFISKL